MACLAKDGRLLFHVDGERKVIRLTKLPKKRWPIVQHHVERLLACRIDGSAPPDDTMHWLEGISEALREKLVSLGVIKPKSAPTITTLGELIESFKARPRWAKYKANTQISKNGSFSHMLRHFGPDRLIDEITVADAADFYDALGLPADKGGHGLSAASSNLVATAAHTLFNYAIDAELISRSPFRKVPRAVISGVNAHVSDALCRDVLEALTDTQDRLIFALSRWGGLRIPSDALGLCWCDLDWEKQRFLVHSPKAERFGRGKDKRWVPIFTELAPLFSERWDAAAEGEEYVLPKLRANSTGYPQSMLRRALKQLGVDPWPRLWHSMRATRQTELEVITKDRHMVCSWMGNTPKVAGGHYINYTDQDFQDRAAEVAQICHSKGR